MTARLHIRQTNLQDGRSLSLYGWDKHDGTPIIELPAVPPMPHITPGILEHHPLLREYVCTSPARQNRTFKPAADACPLCPSTPDNVNEVPFADFDVAVFDNRFPSFAMPERSLPLQNNALHPARGKCEVVVYAPDHTKTMASMTDEQRLLVVDTWVHRYDTLLGLPSVEYVHVFENRGDAAGVTLHHPHGQIYAMPFTPPIQQTIGESFKAKPDLLSQIIVDHPDMILAEQDGIVAFCPEFGRFSYEIWIAPRNRHSGLWNFDRTERQALATLLGKVTKAYDRLFNKPMSYMMAIHSAPKPFENVWHTHITFQPLLRTADKQKYVASVELTSGVYLKDVTARDAVGILKPLFDNGDSV